MKKPERENWEPQALPDCYDADAMDAWLAERDAEILAVLREMREWVANLHTGIAGVAVMAVYESGKLDALITRLEAEYATES